MVVSEDQDMDLCYFISNMLQESVVEKIVLNVEESEFQRLNKEYPATEKGKSSNVGNRAIELVKLHFRSLDPNCSFAVPTDGSDLEINSGKETKRIEVKGTADNVIAWGQLKVSGQPSYKLLLEGLPLYRVCGVYSASPVVYIMQCGRDFEMLPEPRWMVRAIKKAQPA